MSAYIILGSIVAAAGVGEAGTVDKILEQGATAGSLSAAAVWAIVAGIAVIGLVKLYVDKSKDDVELKSIIKDTTAAIVTNTETLLKLNNNIDKCSKR